MSQSWPSPSPHRQIRGDFYFSLLAGCHEKPLGFINRLSLNSSLFAKLIFQLDRSDFCEIESREQVSIGGREGFDEVPFPSLCLISRHKAMQCFRWVIIGTDMPKISEGGLELSGNSPRGIVHYGSVNAAWHASFFEPLNKRLKRLAGDKRGGACSRN